MAKRPKKTSTRKESVAAGDPSRHDAMAEAFLQSELMDETRTYLTRGRQLASSDTEAVSGLWTAAFKKWFATRAPEDARNSDDAAAELRLRGMKPPYDRVQAELAAMRAEIARDYPADEEWSETIRAKIHKFREGLERSN